MKLGYIKIPDTCREQNDSILARSHLLLANGLDFQFTYFPKIDPRQLDLAQIANGSTPKIAFDASGFGDLAPNEIDCAVRMINDTLDGRLSLGVEVCTAAASPKSKARAQAFETMFSYGPKVDHVQSTSRFPMTSPCLDIVGLPITGSRDEARRVAALGYSPMTPSWLTDKDVARIWPGIVEGATSVLRRACPSRWQVNRVVVLHDDPHTLNSYVFGANSPIRRHFTKLAQAGLINADIDAHLRRVVIAGPSQKVVDDILALREAVGDFGMLNIIDPVGSDPQIMSNTLKRLAGDVMPMVAAPSINDTKNLERT